MLISGTWHLCDDGITRPVLRGEIRASDGSWVEARFLVDTAADRTAFSADVLEALRLPAVTPLEQLSGVGGAAPSVLVDTQVVFPHGADGRVAFRGRYAAFTELEALDICVLGPIFSPSSWIGLRTSSVSSVNGTDTALWKFDNAPCFRGLRS